MQRKRIEQIVRSGKTALAVGPVSRNCTDVVIELANTYQIPLTLIASRRQVDDQSFGGGYVNSWTTAEYCAYVKRHDTAKHVIIGRDHAGPWQNENFLVGLDEAMESAKRSLKADIECGIQFLHLDPSLDSQGTPRVEEILRRIFDLHLFCHEQALKLGVDVEFEFGPFTAEILDEPVIIEYALEQIYQHCQKHQLPMPLNVVVNTGTKVMETRNVGCFEPQISSTGEGLRKKIKAFVSLCNQYKVFLKEHNADYLSSQTLSAHPVLGIHSANIAPEMGVIETSALLDLLQQIGRQDLYEEFITLSVGSLKWQKWMLPETTPAREYVGRISGHYVYSHPRGKAIRQELHDKLNGQGIDLEQHLKARIRARIVEHLKCFRLIEA